MKEALDAFFDVIVEASVDVPAEKLSNAWLSGKVYAWVWVSRHLQLIMILTSLNATLQVQVNVTTTVHMCAALFLQHSFYMYSFLF